MILLTAVQQQEIKMESLEQGADGYLTKPFPYRELHLRIHNILRRQEHLHELYKRDALPEKEKNRLNPYDQELMRRIDEQLEKNLSNEMYSIEHLSEDVGLSDTCISPFAGGSSHSPVEVMAVIAERMGYDHGLDKEAITKAQDVLREIFVELKNSTPSFAKGWHKPVHFEDVPVEKVDRFVEAIMKEPVDLKTAIDLSREIMADLDYPKYDDRTL